MFRICQLAKRLRLKSKGSLSKIIQTLLSRQNCWVTCVVVMCWAPEYIHHAVVQSLSRIISSCNEIMWIQSILNLILVFRIIPCKFKIAEYKKCIMFLTGYYKKWGPAHCEPALVLPLKAEFGKGTSVGDSSWCLVTFVKQNKWLLCLLELY